MEALEPVLIYRESNEELRQKLVNATLELETMKNDNTELLNLLMMAYQERDEARGQLHKLKNKFMPSNTTHLQNVYAGCEHPILTGPLVRRYLGVQHENHLMLHAAKANSSITESNSLSHGSSPVDSFFDTVSSSPEFSNITTTTNNNNNNNNMSTYLNQHLFQDFNNSASHDPATAFIDSLAKGKALPQKGKLLQAVMDAGPLLQNVLLAGPLPNWRNPPSLQHIKVPPLTIKECDSTSNTIKHSSNATKCSGSMLSFAGQPSDSLNNAWQLTSCSRKRQRHQ